MTITATPQPTAVGTRRRVGITANPRYRRGPGPITYVNLTCLALF